MEFLFRGTTEGWPGAQTSQQLPVTPTSSDPLVATLFAIRCRRFGKAIVLVARRDAFASQMTPNVLGESECEVPLPLPPPEFAKSAIIKIGVEEAMRILASMGFDLPGALPDNSALSAAISESHSRRIRLSSEQIGYFVEIGRAHV